MDTLSPPDILLRPHFLDGAATLFDHLVQHIAWAEGAGPRISMTFRAMAR